MYSPKQKNYKQISFGISQKRDGCFNLRSSCWENRIQFFTNLQYFNLKLRKDRQQSPVYLAQTKLTHSNTVIIIDRYQHPALYLLGRHQDKNVSDNKNKARSIEYPQSRINHLPNIASFPKINFPQADALITHLPHIYLTVTTADCLPIYFYDQEQQVIGLAHAGWRGVQNGVLTHTVLKLQQIYQTKPAQTRVWIGPHLQQCHFEVQSDLQSIFPAFCQGREEGNRQKVYLNLAKQAMQQLQSTKIPSKNIKINKQCTYCFKNKYFSYRRDKPEQSQSMVNWIIKHY